MRVVHAHSAVCKQINALAVTELPVTRLAGDLREDAILNKAAREVVGGGEADLGELDDILHGDDNLVHIARLAGAENLGLSLKHVVERTLRALDLTGQHCFLAHVHEHEEVGGPARSG